MAARPKCSEVSMRMGPAMVRVDPEPHELQILLKNCKFLPVDRNFRKSITENLSGSDNGY